MINKDKLPGTNLALGEKVYQISWTDNSSYIEIFQETGKLHKCAIHVHLVFVAVTMNSLKYFWIYL